MKVILLNFLSIVSCQSLRMHPADFDKVDMDQTIFLSEQLGDRINVNPRIAMALTNGTWNIQCPAAGCEGNLSKALVIDYTPMGMTKPLQVVKGEHACRCLTNNFKDSLTIYFLGDSHTRNLMGSFYDMLFIGYGDKGAAVAKDVDLPETFQTICGGNNRYLNEEKCWGLLSSAKIGGTRTVCDGKVFLEYRGPWKPNHFTDGKLEQWFQGWDEKARMNSSKIGVVFGAGSHFVQNPSVFKPVGDKVLNLIDKHKEIISFAVISNLPSQICHTPDPKRSVDYARQEPNVLKGNAMYKNVADQHPNAILLDTFSLAADTLPDMTQTQRCELRAKDESHGQLPLQMMRSTVALRAICAT